MMTWLYQTSMLGEVPILHLDMLALLMFIGAWFGYARYADRQYHKRLNLIRIMDDMRARWMLQMIKRENRIADATLVGNILRSIYFFASTTILILLGIITILGAQDKGMQFIHAMPYSIPSTPFMFEFKCLLLAVVFVYAFFKLTWSLRQYNYACIIVGAAPAPGDTPQHRDYAERAGKLIGNAGQHFNMGMRAYYFGLAASAWFINGLLFILITIWIVWIVYRREFRSHTVNNLIALDDQL